MLLSATEGSVQYKDVVGHEVYDPLHLVFGLYSSLTLLCV